MGFEFKEIPTSRLVLRSLRLEDADTFLRYRSKTGVAGVQTGRSRVIREILRFIARQKKAALGTPNTWMQLAVSLKGKAGMIGDCGIHFLPPDARQVEIGFTIESAYRGRGFGTEAVRALLDYSFRGLHAHRVCASVDPSNAPSIALLERVGLRKEAHFRKSLLMDGKWVDDMVFAMLDEEWERDGLSI